MDKKSNKKYFLNIILILVLGATVIYFTMKDDLHASLRALTTASPLWIVISFALMSIYFLLDGINLYTFGKLYKKDYSYKQGFVNSISGTFFNGVTPFSSGGQFAQVYIFNKQDGNAGTRPKTRRQNLCGTRRLRHLRRRLPPHRSGPRRPRSRTLHADGPGPRGHEAGRHRLHQHARHLHKPLHATRTLMTEDGTTY